MSYLLNYYDDLFFISFCWYFTLEQIVRGHNCFWGHYILIDTQNFWELHLNNKKILILFSFYSIFVFFLFNKFLSIKFRISSKLTKLFANKVKCIIMTLNLFFKTLNINLAKWLFQGKFVTKSDLSDMVCFNVGGKKFYCMRENFLKLPTTRLGLLVKIVLIFFSVSFT